MQDKDTMELDENEKSEASDEQAEITQEEDPCEASFEEVLEEEKKDEKEIAPGKKEKRGFRKKKDKKDEQIEELNDRLMRTMAEFDNFRKRTEREKSQMFVIGAKDIVEKILPVIDNFERGLNSIPTEEKESAFVQGIEQIYKQLMTTLESAGVVPIDAIGKEFDPNFHNAVMHADDENFGENMVSEELQKGYMYRESVVRHSMVKVVN